MSDNGQIKMSVGLSPIVQSVGTASVGQPITLQLISGLNANELFWRCDGKEDIPTPSNLIITFDEPGFYIPVAQGHVLHEYYGINVVIQAPYTMDGL